VSIGPFLKRPREERDEENHSKVERGRCEHLEDMGLE